jgi:hypothetical protein
MVQAGYAESMMRTFGMWDCNPVLTPLDPNVRLTKRDSPEIVDPRLHRRMRSIVGCLSSSSLVDTTKTKDCLSVFAYPALAHRSVHKRLLISQCTCSAHSSGKSMKPHIRGRASSSWSVVQRRRRSSQAGPETFFTVSTYLQTGSRRAEQGGQRSG